MYQWSAKKTHHVQLQTHCGYIMETTGLAIHVTKMMDPSYLALIVKGERERELVCSLSLLQDQ